MGGRNASSLRALADEVARHSLRIDAGRMVLGIPACRDYVSVHLSAVQRQSGSRLARDVLDRGCSCTAHVLDSQWRARKPGLAGTEAAVEAEREQTDLCGAENLGGTNFSARLDFHYVAYDSRHRFLHVRVLLGKLLVPDVPPGIRTLNSSLSGGFQFRSHHRRC